MAKTAFTAGKVAGFKCPADKTQVFMWDSTAPGLGLRLTPAGKPAYVFQGVYRCKDVRLTIGSLDAWTIPLAQNKARELQRLIDGGNDPRNLKRDAVAAHTKKQVDAAVHAVTGGEAWTAYMVARKPHWGDRHYLDHEALCHAGGEPFKRGNGVTKPGLLAPLLAMPLSSLSAPVVEAWAAQIGRAHV